MLTVLILHNVESVYFFFSNPVCRKDIQFMEQQFLLTHTICQTGIPALLDSWITNASSVKVSFFPQNSGFSLYFRQNITRLIVGILRVCQFCLSPVKLYIGELRQISLSGASRVIRN